MTKGKFSYQNLHVYEDMIRSISSAENLVSSWNSIHAITDHFNRASEGEEPDNGTPDVKGHWKIVTIHRGPKRPEFPIKPPKPRYWTLAEFLKHLKLLHEHYYLKRGQKPPTIHCIGYKIDKEGNAFLKALAKEYKGKYRRVRTLKSR